MKIRTSFQLKHIALAERSTLALIGVLLMVVAAVLAGCGGGSASQNSAAPSSAAGPSPAAISPGQPPVPASSHVLVVIEENHNYADAMAHMPWLVAQAQANGIAANYVSNEGGSALDYFWLSSGSSESQYGCDGNGCQLPIKSDNIFRELDKLGTSWKVYAQGLPSAGDVRHNNAGAYVVRHNPAIWYTDVINASAAYRQQHIVPDTELSSDLANNALPSFAFLIPDVNHDAHDGTLAQADAYLQKTLTPLLKSPAFQPGGDGLLFVTFDECGGGTNAGCDGRVLTAVIGPKVAPETISNRLYQHQNVLRTVLDALGVANYPGASAIASDMSDFFAH
jgi:phosphatidylinositol-3-phosphatase